MSDDPTYIPSGYHAVTPYLALEGVPQFIEFLRQVFDARESERLLRPDGSIAHAEIRISDSVIMLSESTEQNKPMPSAFYVYVPDTDTSYQRALEAGATSLMEPADQVYGDRSAGLADPFGNHWWLATHVKDVPIDVVQQHLDSTD